MSEKQYDNSNYDDKEENINEEEQEMNVEDPDEVIFCERKRWLFLGLPFSLTKYTITPTMVTIDKGLINSTEDDCYIYKIVDVKMRRNLLEKIVGLGTVCCYTSDNTDPSLILEHIKNAKEVKKYLLKQSEQKRMEKRTLATQDLSARGGDLNHNGIPDFMER